MLVRAFWLQPWMDRICGPGGRGALHCFSMASIDASCPLSCPFPSSQPRVLYSTLVYPPPCGSRKGLWEGNPRLPFSVAHLISIVIASDLSPFCRDYSTGASGHARRVILSLSVQHIFPHSRAYRTPLTTVASSQSKDGRVAFYTGHTCGPLLSSSLP